MLLRQRSTSVQWYRGLCTEFTALAVHGSSFMRAWRKQSKYWNAINTLQTSMTPPLKTPWIPYYENANRQNTRLKRTPTEHLQTSIREHTKNPGPVKNHLRNCNTTITEEHIDILASTSRGEGYLLTLEALFIQELEPKINTKDEWRSRTLTIKI